MKSLRATTTPRVVLLDVGYTLLKPYPSIEEVCHDVSRRLGIDLSVEQLQGTRHRVEGYYYTARNAEPHIWAAEETVRRFWVAFYSEWLRLSGLDGQAEHLAEAIYDEFAAPERWTTYPDVLPALEELTVLGLRLGAVSDWGLQLAPILHGMALSRYLEFAVVSASVGAAKPDAYLYELALARAAATAEETWHVGDDYRNDVLGARGAGVYPVLLDRSGKAPRVDCPLIHDLRELPALVRAAGCRRLDSGERRELAR
ncbi:MAG: HAD-IA family hydrolase [Chloroflexi bacterium]|nr:HAD-IA family hydrolase [Chloroflexota bacterium]